MQIKILNLLDEANQLKLRVKSLLNGPNLGQSQKFVLKHINSDLSGILSILNLKNAAFDSNIRSGGEYTLEEIGTVLGGVSRERIRQIESSALKKLKHPKIIRNFYNYIRL